MQFTFHREAVDVQDICSDLAHHGAVVVETLIRGTERIPRADGKFDDLSQAWWIVSA